MLAIFNIGSFITENISTLLVAKRLKMSGSNLLFTTGFKRSDFAPKRRIAFFCLATLLTYLQTHYSLHCLGWMIKWSCSWLISWTNSSAVFWPPSSYVATLIFSGTVFAALFFLLGDGREEFSRDENVKIEFRNGPHQKPSSICNICFTPSRKIVIAATCTLQIIINSCMYLNILQES